MRSGSRLDADARQTIQEVYNNLASNLAMSKVYVVLRKGDPQRPWLTFDQVVAGRTADSSTPRAQGAPEVTEHELRQIQEQLAWFAREAPRAQGMHVSALSSPELTISDNTRYSPTHPSEADRAGLVYSVPFYDKAGQLQGCVAGILLTSVLGQELTGYNGLRNAATHLTVPAWDLVEQERTQEMVEPLPAEQKVTHWIARGQRMPGLIYWKEQRLQVEDGRGPWTLWTARPDEDFWARPDVQAARDFGVLGGMFAGLLTVGLLAFYFVSERARSVIESQNTQLSRSEGNLRAIFGHAADGIVTFRLSGELDSFNPAAERSLGGSPAGANVADLIPELRERLGSSALLQASRIECGHLELALSVVGETLE